MATQHSKPRTPQGTKARRVAAPRGLGRGGVAFLVSAAFVGSGGGLIACGGACRAAEPSAPASEAARAHDAPVDKEKKAEAQAASGFAQPPPAASAPAPEGAPGRDGLDPRESRAERAKGDRDDELAEREALDTLADAEAALKRYSERLAAVNVGRLAVGPTGGAAAGRTAPAAPAKPAATAAPKSAPEGNDCQEVCRAFSGLKRAADAVCRLAGDGSERCGRAKKLVSENRPRVAPCGCGE